MKFRARWLVLAAAIILLGAAIIEPRLWAVFGTAVLAAVAWIARQARAVVALIRAETGIVEGQGDPFVPVDGAPDLLYVWAASEDPAAARRVQLPEGIKAEDVRAVVIIPSGRATVELLP